MTQHAMYVDGVLSFVEPRSVFVRGRVDAEDNPLPDVEYPHDIFRKWSRADKAAVGLFEVDEAPAVGSGPMLVSEVLAEAPDGTHAILTKTWRPRTQEEIDTLNVKRTQQITRNDMGRAILLLFRVCLRMAELNGATPAQFRNLVDQASADGRISLADLEDIVRREMEK